MEGSPHSWRPAALKTRRTPCKGHRSSTRPPPTEFRSPLERSPACCRPRRVGTLDSTDTDRAANRSFSLGWF
eukprot:168441-Prymnesium_polylepis.1